MQDTSKVQQDIIRRLKSVSGHLNGVIRMVEEDQYCIDIINQIGAAQAALNKASLLVLDNHLHSCVIEAVRGDNPAEREQALDEIRDVFEARSKL